EHFIILVITRLVFERIFFPEGENIHLVNIENSFEIGVTYKTHPEKVIGLTLHPVSCSPEIRCSRYFWLADVKETLQTHTNILRHVVKMIYNAELFLVRSLDSCKVSEKMKIEFVILFQKLQHIMNH